MLRLPGQLLGRLLGQILDRGLARCLLCRCGSDVSAGICNPCRQDLPALSHRCLRCALPLPPPRPNSADNGADSECPRCLQQPPAHASADACWYYAYPVAQLIQRFKYQRDMAAGRTLAELAAVQLQPRHERPDLLVPLPLHWRRQFSRGYNQAQLIAAILGHHWEIPVSTSILRKTTRTGSQQQLKRDERLKNLSRSFHASAKVSGLHIGLVDDVITTGATLEAASQTLLNAGAAKVSAYALARTP